MRDILVMRKENRDLKSFGRCDKAFREHALHQTNKKICPSEPVRVVNSKYLVRM